MKNLEAKVTFSVLVIIAFLQAVPGACEQAFNINGEAAVRLPLYKKPLHYGETAVVHTWIEDYNGFKTVYGYHIYNPAGELSIKATSSHICVDKESFKPIQFRKAFPDWHTAYEKAKK